jgi:hypothetical protein
MKKYLNMAEQWIMTHLDKPRVRTFLFGEFPKGKKIGRHKETIISPPERPSFTEWCQEFNVSSKVNQNKPVYYEI